MSEEFDSQLLEDFLLDTEEIPSPGNINSPKRKKPKRNQVPKACSNCRKNHAGCDLQRPCRRCIQQGLESSCVDVPRKKRASKTKEKNSPPPSALESLSFQLPDMESWKETYDELFGSEVTTDIPETILKELTTSETPIMTSFQQPLTPKITTEPPPSSELLQELVRQMNDLKTSNKNLESRLNNVTQELENVKSVENKRLSVLSEWHSFQPANQLAISTWKKIAPSTNVLVECNQQFVQLLGYPLEHLQNNFTCDRLLPKSNCTQANTDETNNCKDLQCKDYTKRTQIMTNFGLKEVFMTLTPVPNQSSGLCYLLSILPVL